MNSITVNTQTLTNKASEVDEMAADYMSHYEALLNDVNTLTTSDWQGEDATAFRNQVEGFRDDFQKMRDLMGEYADFLREAANKYDSMQDNLINTIKGLQN